MNRNIRWILPTMLIIALGLALETLAATPKSEPFGDLHAVRGGTLVLHTSDFPKSFNVLVNTSVDASEVFGLVYDTLMEVDPNTLEYQPLIAKSWQISPDQKTFTITIDPRAKWADGKQITTTDVKFTYDTIMNPKNLTSVQRMFMSRFDQPVIIDKYTIKFSAKNIHYNNLITLADFNIIPKHLFEGKDFNKTFNMQLPPGSGPYILSDVKEGRYYELTRRKNYWADCLPQRRGTYNFHKIRYKIIANDTAFEAFKKGDFDVYDFITPKRWVTETNSEQFKKNWVVKQKFYNYAPHGFYGLALNMRKPPLNDLRVRKALFYLLDRDYIIKKIRYNQEQPITSYWPSLYGSKKANYDVDYNPGKAKQLLQEAGFNRLDNTGYLINPKKEHLEITIYYVLEESETYLTNFVDSCKKAGVKINLKRMSWATMIKKMNEYKYDALEIAWSGTLFEDPEQLWHSKHLNEVGGSNLPGYKNAKVDQLIDSLPPIFDHQKRIQIIKQIDSIIYNDVPYILYWNRNFSWLFYKNVFGKPQGIIPKYEIGIIKYWWFDPVKSKQYQKAVKMKRSLPKQPIDVYYDKLQKQ